MNNIIEFKKWLNSDTKSYDEGLLLSTFRKQELLRLFQSDPEKAWSYHLKKSELKDIHPDILANIEDYVNDIGDLFVRNACECHEGELERYLVYKGNKYQVYTWGKRATISSKKSLPFHAIILFDKAVLYKKSFITKEEINNQLKLDANFETNIVKKEQSKNFNSFQDLAAPSYVNGQKRILYIRANFKGETGEVVPLETAKQHQNDVSEYYRINSKGSLILTTDFTDVVELEKSAGEYPKGDFFSLLDAGARAAKAKNPAWDIANYDFYAVVTREPGQFQYAGRAWIGAPGMHLINTYSIMRISAHELGHNLGLFHANFWGLVKNPLDTGAANYSYGHEFSVMGGKYTPEFYDPTKPMLAPVELFELGWLKEEDGGLRVLNDSPKTTYRLYPLEKSDGLRAIKINKATTDFEGNLKNYWICFRHYFNTQSKKGVQFDWTDIQYGTNYYCGVLLLDMATLDNSELGSLDCTLKPGRSFYDPKAKIYFKTLALSSDINNPYVDIEIGVNVENTVDPTNPPPNPEPEPKPITIDPLINSVYARAENINGGEVAKNLIDGKSNTKWLDFSKQTWFQINYKESVMLNSFTLTSANDEPARDPHTISLLIDDDELLKWEGVSWSGRFQNKQFTIPSGVAVGDHFTFALTSNASMTQLAEYNSISQPYQRPPELVKESIICDLDVYADETAPKTVLGQKWDLFVKSEIKYRRISYLAFLLPQVTKVEKATLNLFARIDRKDYTQSLKLNIHESDDQWEEDKVFWANKPIVGEKIAEFILLTPPNAAYSIDLTDYVNNKLASEIYSFGIAIQADRPIEYIAKINSSESNNPPVLSVEYFQ